MIDVVLALWAYPFIKFAACIIGAAILVILFLEKE